MEARAARAECRDQAMTMGKVSSQGFQPLSRHHLPGVGH
jgi:hypothetical protein